jgi:hypothetical protein
MNWESATARERDAWVAEHVMGLLQVKMSRSWRDPETGEEQIHVEDDDEHPDMTSFGNEPCPSHISEFSSFTCDAAREPVPNYTTDPAADYLVLEKVRETWDTETLEAFAHGLYATWVERDPKQHEFKSSVVWLPYQPGDYSHSAFLALSGN